MKMAIYSLGMMYVYYHRLKTIQFRTKLLDGYQTYTQVS